MSIYDIAMLIVLGGAIWFGFWKGLAWQIASLAAIIVSYIVSVNFRDPVSQFIQAEAPWNRIGAMLILFLGTSLLIWTIYARVAKGLKKAELKGFDRQMGALLGALKGAILCMVITVFSVSLLGQNAHDTIHHSRTGRYVVKGIGLVSSIIPEELAQFVDPHVENFENVIGHSTQQPIENYPQTAPNQYPVSGPNHQDPSQLPPSQYRGQWQTPTTQAGYGTQTPYANQQNTGNQQQGYGTQQGYGNQQSYGTQQPAGQQQYGAGQNYNFYGNQNQQGQASNNGQYNQQQYQNQNQYQQKPPATSWQQPNTGVQSTGYGGQFNQQTQQQYGTQNGAGQMPDLSDFSLSEKSRQLLLDAAIERAKDAARNIINTGGQNQ